MKNNIKLSIIIPTFNEKIERVKKELLPQLKDVYEVVISHQITNPSIIPETENLWHNVKYIYMYDKWLSKNRNNAIKHATWDICHICDDDLDYVNWFQDVILNTYQKFDADLITFDAINENWESHYNLQTKKHSNFSLLNIWSIWITFQRKNNIFFDEKFWLGTAMKTWEDNIFLIDCLKTWLKIYHQNTPIVIHPDESSGHVFDDDMIFARIQVWKRMFWFMWWVLAVFYFTFTKYRLYKDKYSLWMHFSLSCKSLIK